MNVRSVMSRLRRMPGWLLFFLACFGWFLVVELGCFAYLFAIRNNEAHPVSWLLHGMVDRFHPLFHSGGHFTASNYYPYVAAYHEGDWSETPAPAPLHPDGWVLPQPKGEDGSQRYVSPDKPAGTLRVVVLGGSTMVGMGQSSPEKSIPVVLESLLGRAYPQKKIEVVNGAFYTHTASQEMAALATKLIIFHPDLILVFDGYNEFVRAYHFPDMPPFWSVPHEQMYRTYNRVQSFKGSVAQLGFLLSKRFYCLALLRAIRYNRRFMAVADVPKEQALNLKPYARAIDEYLVMHKNILGIARAHDIPVFLAAQPNLFYRKPLSEEEKKVHKQWDTSKPRYSEASDFFFPELDRRYGEFAKKRSAEHVHLLNMTRMFEDVAETLYVDSCHYNDRGAELVARALFAPTAKALGLSPKKTPK
ncbi:hypothetical protein ACFL2T_05015 [Elusimicrobiota bacterium]